MPLKRCENDGWKWGDQGKCFTGPDAKQKAIRQGIAIEGPEKFSQKAFEDEDDFEKKDVLFVDQVMCDEGVKIGTRIAVALTLGAISNRFIYENPKTGEQYTFRRRGNHRKGNVVLMYVGEA